MRMSEVTIAAIRDKYTAGLPLRQIATETGAGLASITKYVRDMPGRYPSKGRKRAERVRREGPALAIVQPPADGGAHG